MELRVAKQYSVNDDALPLHSDFYQFVQKDERGLFIQDKDGNRWDIELQETVDVPWGRFP